jgi:hypothetical protein
MLDDGRQRLSISALAGRCLGIVAGAFALGLLLGHLMSGGEAAYTNEPGSALPLVPVSVSAQPAAPTQPPRPSPPAATPTSNYVVQAGDSLTSIAGRFRRQRSGDYWRQRYNPAQRPRGGPGPRHTGAVGGERSYPALLRPAFSRRGPACVPR